jgi:phosphorylcholine metabolism protein LicD
MSLTNYISKKDINVITKPFYNYEKGTKLENDVIIQDLIEVCDVMVDVGVDYNVLFGTLLGMYRDGKLIDHDPDVDIAIKSSQKNDLIKVIEILLDKGFKLTRYSREQLVSVYKNNVYIDIYLFNNLGQYYKCSVYSINKEVFDADNFVECGGYSFKTIENPEQFFETMYGLDWKTPIVGVHAHPSRKGKTHG